MVFIGGSDEHGVPVTIRARKEGITVQEVVDRYHNLIKDSFEKFGISFDIYSRTTSSIHNKFASDFFRKLYDDGKLEEITEEQYCDEVTGEFLTDRNIVGTCPVVVPRAPTATSVRSVAPRSLPRNSSTRPTRTTPVTDW